MYKVIGRNVNRIDKVLKEIVDQNNAYYDGDIKQDSKVVGAGYVEVDGKLTLATIIEDDYQGNTEFHGILFPVWADKHLLLKDEIGDSLAGGPVFASNNLDDAEDWLKDSGVEGIYVFERIHPEDND